MNSLFGIVTYKCKGIWVFDDPVVGLTKEALIAGTNGIRQNGEDSEG
jgi:hypothetical protein